jgi:2-keto-myo-inositol isomerase
MIERRTMPFRYSLNSSTIKPTPILEKIRVAAAAGYGAIELWHADIDEHLQRGGSLDEIRQAVDDHGLAVPTTIMLKGWCESDGPEYDAGIAECRRRLEQAAAVGAPHAVAGPPHGPVDFDLAADRYRRLLEIGIEMGVRPAMEYLGFAQEVNSIADALRIMDGSGHPEATIVLDPFHDFRGGAGHEDIAKLTPERIAVCHFDDAPASPPASQQRDPDRVMPGEGVIDLKRFTQLLTQIGYDGWISLELFREDLWSQDPLAVARRGLEAMKRICEPG